MVRASFSAPMAGGELLLEGHGRHRGMLAVTTVPFGFGGGLLLAVLKLSRNRHPADRLRRLHDVLPRHPRPAGAVHRVFRAAGAAQRRVGSCSVRSGAST